MNEKLSHRVQRGSEGKAFTYIKGEVHGIAILTAVVSTDVIQSSKLTFSKALPDAMYVYTDVLEAASGPSNLLTIKMKLTKATGKPSTGYIPQIQAFDNAGTSIGI